MLVPAHVGLTGNDKVETSAKQDVQKDTAGLHKGRSLSDSHSEAAGGGNAPLTLVANRR